MNSVWLCIDAGDAMRLRAGKRIPRAQTPGAPPAVLGIFTDDPKSIARRLPRPLTPFVPAPEAEPVRGCEPLQLPQAFADDAIESPPRAGAFEFGSPKYSAVPCRIAIF
jgi:hypothetical protein